MHGEDRPNIKTQLIIGALKFAEFPDHAYLDRLCLYKSVRNFVCPLFYIVVYPIKLLKKKKKCKINLKTRTVTELCTFL